MEDDGRILNISLVVPVYSGETYLPRLVEAVAGLRKRWASLDSRLHIPELILALDEPVDDSTRVARQLAEEFGWVRPVELSRNYGQHSATVAGILYSSGDWVVTLDEDLQHHPDYIESLLTQAVEAHADLVYALPRTSVHGGMYRDWSSRLAKWLVSKLSGNPAVMDFNSFRLIRGDIARAAASICAQNTYFDVALTWFTNRISRVALDLTDDRHKVEKKSGYNFISLARHAKRLLVSSNFKVLWFASIMAIVSFLLAVGYGAWIVLLKLFSDRAIDAPGWASLMVVILGFGAIGVFMLGVIIDLMHMSMLQILGKPAFFVVDRESDDILAREVARLASDAGPQDS